MSPLVLATRSAGKLRELEPIFIAAQVAVIDLVAAGIAESPDEDAIEVFETFEENALAKARYFHERSGGMPAVADDSGLEVVALGGAPGVRSKRWSTERDGARRDDLAGQALDDANNAKLVESVRGAAERRARYVCVAAYVDGECEVVRRGETDGLIVDEPRGAGGFGYDPYFFSVELGWTFGEASLSEKERISHRGRAFRALVEELRRRGGGSGVDRASDPGYIA